MNNIFSISLAIFGIMYSVNSFSQEKDYQFDQLTIQDGLSNNTVNCIFQDSDGFIWVGTDDGLNKFDGYNFTTYNYEPDDSSSLTATGITCLYQDSKGTIWIGTNQNGLSYLDEKNNRIKQHKWPLNLIDNFYNIRSIIEDKDSCLWIAGPGGIIQFNLNDSTKKSYTTINSRIPSDGIKAIAESKNGTIWIGMTELGFCSLNKYTGKFQYHEELNQEIRKTKGIKLEHLYIDSEDNLWMSINNSGVYKLNLANLNLENIIDTPSAPKYLKTSSFRKINEIEKNIWIGTDNGICIYNKEQRTIETIQYNTNLTRGLNNGQVNEIFYDKQNIIWLGTKGGGLNIYDKHKNRFLHFKTVLNKQQFFGNNTIFSFAENEDYIWIGSDNGLFAQQKSTGIISKIAIPEINNNTSIRDVEIRENGNLLISAIGHPVFECKVQNKTLGIVAKYAINSNNAHDITITNNSFWVCDMESGVYHFDGNKSFGENFGDSLKKQLRYPRVIAEDKNGNIWIGTHGQGLFFYNTDNESIIQYQKNDSPHKGPSSSIIYCIYIDANNKVWIGTQGGGLNMFDSKNQRFTVYTKNDGLPNNVVYGILEDNDGFLWISTNAGLAKFNPENSEILVYDEKDGLQSNEFRYNACLKLKNGSLLFGGINGYNLFHPKNITPNNFLPKILLTNFRFIHDTRRKHDKLKQEYTIENINEEKEISLPFYKNSFIIEYVGLNFTLPEKNQYAYYLKGFETDWNYVGNERKATYTNISPGTYTFEVKASNNDQAWNNEAKTLRITITPPFYKTFWFISLLAILITLLIYSYYRYRLVIITKRNINLENEIAKRTRQLKTANSELKHNQEILIKKQDEVREINKQLKAQNEEINKKNEEIQLMAEELHESDQVKIKFLTNISHEFRTPLTLIIGPLEKLLSGQAVSNNVRNQLNTIYRNALRLLELINELLDFRKIDSGRMEMKVSEYNLANFIKGIASHFELYAQQQNIKVNLISSEKKLFLWFDAEKLEKVIFNILSNAFKFSPKNSEISIEIKQETRDKNNFATIIIHDNGPGINDGDLKQIFERFYEGRQKGIRSQGSGIGLSLCKELVKLHHGNIYATSEQGKGTTFTIELLMGKQHFQESQLIEHPVDLPVSDNSFSFIEGYAGDESLKEKIVNKHKPLVLIVEDNIDLMNYIEEILQDEFNIKKANNGKTGYELAQNEVPDLIISDIMMPEMDGFEMCSLLKENLITCHIPLILLTAKSNDEARHRGLNMGADDYITKPFNAKLLSTRVKNLIAIRENLKTYYQRNMIFSHKKFDPNSMDKQFIEKVEKIIYENLENEDFNTEMLAKKMTLSRTQLYRKILAVTNTPASEFIRNIKLNKAASLLAEGNKTVSEVAYLTGFRDPSHFTKTFLKQFGCTPSKFINPAK